MSLFPFVWVRRGERKRAPRLAHRVVRPAVVALALAVALTLVVVAAAGCGKAPAAADSAKAGSGAGAGTGSGSSTTGTYSITVQSNGKTLKTLTLNDIKALPAVKVVADDKTQEGPKLSDVLKAAGVQKYTEVTVTGAWKETYTLKADQADDTVVLDLSNRGTCKLAGPKIPKDSWVRDVTTIEVK